MENGFYAARVTDSGAKVIFADENVLADQETKRLFEERDRKLREQQEAAARGGCQEKKSCQTVVADAPWKRMYPAEGQGLGNCAGRVLLYGAIGIASFLCQQAGLMDWRVAFPVELAMMGLAGYQVGKLIAGRV